MLSQDNLEMNEQINDKANLQINQKINDKAKPDQIINNQQPNSK